VNLPAPARRGSLQRGTPVAPGHTAFATRLLPDPDASHYAITSFGLLTVREVAAALNVSRATVYRLVNEGHLPHARVLNAIRVLAEDVRLFLAAAHSWSAAR